MRVTVVMPDCFYCHRPVDLENEPFELVDTLETVLKKKAPAVAHEVCAADAAMEHMEDKAREDQMDYVDELNVEDDYYGV